jgi:hypothetical protein
VKVEEQYPCIVEAPQPINHPAEFGTAMSSTEQRKGCTPALRCVLLAASMAPLANLLFPSFFDLIGNKGENVASSDLSNGGSVWRVMDGG